MKRPDYLSKKVLLSIHSMPVCFPGVKLQVVTPDEVTFHSAMISWKAPRVAFKSYRLTYQLSKEVKVNTSVTPETNLAAFPQLNGPLLLINRS